MFDNSGMIGEMLERGQSTVRDSAKAAKQGAQSFVQTGLGQVTGSQTPAPQQSSQGTNEQANAAAQNQQKMSDDDAKKYLQDLYGVKNNNQKTQTANSASPQMPQGPKPVNNVKTALGISEPTPEKTNPTQSKSAVATALGVSQADPNAGKTPEEIAKIEALRNQLHGDYYQTLVNPQKSQDEPVTEKLEREEKEEKFEELEKKKKKPDPLVNLNQGTGEAGVGVSG